MKRPLRVVGQPEQTFSPKAVLVQLTTARVSVDDTGDGSAAKRFARLLTESGGALVDDTTEKDPDLRIVIRRAAQAQSSAARLRAEALEEGADVVLGSARPCFARRLALRGPSPKRP